LEKRFGFLPLGQKEALKCPTERKTCLEEKFRTKDTRR